MNELILNTFIFSNLTLLVYLTIAILIVVIIEFTHWILIHSVFGCCFEQLTDLGFFGVLRCSWCQRRLFVGLGWFQGNLGRNACLGHRLLVSQCHLFYMKSYCWPGWCSIVVSSGDPGLLCRLGSSWIIRSNFVIECSDHLDHWRPCSSTRCGTN